MIAANKQNYDVIKMNGETKAYKNVLSAINIGTK